MLGKSKGKSKKKKGKKGDGGVIAPALMPSASITAAPRTPPPPPAPDFQEGLHSSGALGTSIIGRMFTAPGPTDDGPSETDTSLYDYENARNTMPYSTVGSVQFRAMVSPPSGFSDSDYELEAPRRSDPGLRGSRDSQTTTEVVIEPMYATPYKSRPSSGRRKSGSPSPRDRSYGTESDKSFRDSQTYSGYQRDESPEATLRSSGGRSRSAASNGRRAPIDIEERDRVHSTASVTDFRSVTDLSHTASLRLRTLQDQNVHLLEKQRHLEDQLANQLQAQRSLMEKLERHGLLTTQNPDETTASIHDMASLMQETQSITELTLNKHEKLHTSHKERIFVLEKEKNELTELNEQLQAEIISMRRMSSFRDQDEEGGTQAGLLKKQLQDYKDECDTLKSATQRLSSELSRYQAQFRTLPPNELDELPGLPSRGPKPAWLVNTKYLAPLFLAYDDHLREKEGLLQQCQKDIEHFLQEIEKVVKENQRLHIRLEQTDVTGPLGMTEWRSLQEQCKLVLEENQLLMEQLDVQQNKGRDMHKAHVQEVSILSKRLVATEAESSELQQEVAEIKQKYSSMKKQHDEAVIDSRAKPGLDDHLKAVSDLRRLLDDEQGKHGMEIDNIQAQLQTISAEKKGMAAQVTDLQQENQHLETQIRNLLKKHRKSEKKMAILRQALEAAESKEFTAERYLTSVVRMAEKTVHERDSLSQTLTDHERQHKATINKALHGKVAVGRMEEKLKSYKVKATEKLELAASRLKEQDNDFNKQRQEYERELKHMRLMLKERQEMFEGVSTEKRLVEEDLETMWQVASHDNQKMKETVRKTINKLKDHDGLLTRMPTDEFQKEILHSCFSDED